MKYLGSPRNLDKDYRFRMPEGVNDLLAQRDPSVTDAVGIFEATLAGLRLDFHRHICSKV